MWVYYLLQFPSYVILDNAVLSQDMQDVKMMKVGVTYSDFETKIEGVAARAMIVYWEIAERAARRKVAAQQLNEAAEDRSAFA